MSSISTSQSRQQQQKQAHKSQSDASAMNGTSKLDEQLNDDLKNIDEKRTFLKSKKSYHKTKFFNFTNLSENNELQRNGR